MTWVAPVLGGWFGGWFLCVAFDYGGTLCRAGAPLDPVLGMRPMDPDAVEAVRGLRAARVRLVLASNTLPGQDRRLALRDAGVEGDFGVVLQSAQIGVAKPGLFFYRMVIAAAGCDPCRILFVGDNLRADVAGPLACGMHAVLIRPNGLGPGEIAPFGAAVLPDVASVARLLSAAAA